MSNVIEINSLVNLLQGMSIWLTFDHSLQLLGNSKAVQAAGTVLFLKSQLAILLWGGYD